MKSLKIQGFAETKFPKISWDLLIFLYHVTIIQNKKEMFDKDSARFSHIVYKIQALLWTLGSATYFKEVL